ncbi:MAG: magnesium transporter [Oleispira sp.]|jgi:magnesium transporter|tara:strand:+ start:3150 stop:4487 length:1338 start_codon:yes stop_codon:yes gene_type:complete
MAVDEVLSDIEMEELVSKVLLSENSEGYFEEVKNLTIFQQVQLIESLPAEQRLSIWYGIDPTNWWSLIGYLQLETGRNLVNSLPAEEKVKLQKVAVYSEVLSLADILPKSMLDAIMLDQDEKVSLEFQQALTYSDDQVGRFAHRNILRVRKGISIGSVIDRLKRKDFISAVFMVDGDRTLLGYVPIAALFNNHDNDLIETVARPIQGVDDTDYLSDVATHCQFEEGMDYLPVIEDGKLTAAISISVILHEVQEEFASNSVSEAPVPDEDLFGPVSVAMRGRGLWLCINLGTAFLASWVIGFFEIALQQVVALAILMPVVASMGGIAGSQTLAVTVRGLALKHITSANIKLLYRKEMKIAILNGALIGALVAMVVAYWFNSLQLGIIILCAIVINSFAAAASGTYIPFILEKMDVDPAVASAVVLTTVTDVIGFAIFLGLGTLILL